MNDTAVIFILSAVIIILLGTTFYQRLAFRKGMQKTLSDMASELKAILDDKTDGRLMVFTDNRNLMELSSQINRLLEEHQRTRIEFRRSELSSRRMLSNISHDIRTPMTVILGYLEIMRLSGDKKSISGQNLEMLLKVELKARKVMELMEQFFTLAKLEAGDSKPELSRMDICECCRENVLDFYEMLSRKEFKVEIGIPDQPVLVMGNREALQRITGNLITNAVRYGSDGGYLGVFLRQDEKSVFIDVVDKGKGIDPKLSKNVFERLYTLEDSRNCEIQGNGLGLTIARNLAVQMGGDLLLDSQPGVRTVFTLRLIRA